PGRIMAKNPVATTAVTTLIVTVRARSRRMFLPGWSPSSRGEYASIPPPSPIDPQTCYSKRPPAGGRHDGRARDPRPHCGRQGGSVVAPRVHWDDDRARAHRSDGRPDALGGRSRGSAEDRRLLSNPPRWRRS